MNPLQVGQQQSDQMATMPPPVLVPANTAYAQNSVASTTAQPYPVNCITNTIPCMLLYPISRAGKTREVAKAHVDPVAGLFDGKPIPPLYACVRVQELLKINYEDNKIDIPTSDGRTTLGVHCTSAIGPCNNGQKATAITGRGAAITFPPLQATPL